VGQEGGGEAGRWLLLRVREVEGCGLGACGGLVPTCAAGRNISPK